KKLFDLLSHTTTNFSLAIHKSTDATDSAQLLIFAKVIDQNFNLFEKFLGMQTITGQARGLDVYNQVNGLFVQYDLKKENMISICNFKSNNYFYFLLWPLGIFARQIWPPIVQSSPTPGLGRRAGLVILYCSIH
ncbi:hypothetical protein A3Q56_02896, partial [Intoshia linei]